MGHCLHRLPHTRGAEVDVENDFAVAIRSALSDDVSIRFPKGDESRNTGRARSVNVLVRNLTRRVVVDDARHLVRSKASLDNHMESVSGLGAAVLFKSCRPASGSQGRERSEGED